MGRITAKRRAWLDEYLRCFNATEAARRVGFSFPNTQGPRLLLDVGIQKAIQDGIVERCMGKDEVLLRLADIARGDMADLMALTTSGFTFELMIRNEKGDLVPNPKTKLIKRIKQKVTTYLGKRKDDEDREIIETELELYSALDALRDIGKYHALFTDKVKVEGWQTEVVALLKSGALTPKDVLEELDGDLAAELFREAGIDIEINRDASEGGQ